MKHTTKRKTVPTNYGNWPNKAMLGQVSSTTQSVVESYWMPELPRLYNEWLNTSKPSSLPNKNGQAVIQSVSGARSEWHPCHHQVEEFCAFPYAKIWSQYNRPRFYVAQCYRDPFATWMTPQPRVDRHFLDNYNQARARAWHVMQPRFEGEISLINFLWELTDVTHLIQQAYSALRMMKKMIRRRPKLNPRDPTPAASAAVLSWNLSIMPLLKDVTIIWRQIYQKISEYQSKFAKLGEEPNTRHYKEILVDRSTLSTGSSNDYYHEYGSQLNTTFIATLLYGYSYKMRKPHEMLLKYWGLDGSWTALYNAFPFSFVLDYFIKVGDAIRYMEKDKNVNVGVLNYCESLKTIHTSGIHINSASAYGYNFTALNGHIGATGLTTGYRSKLYTRTVGSPLRTGIYVPRVKSPGDKQRLNLLCLARQAFR